MEIEVKMYSRKMFYRTSHKMSSKCNWIHQNVLNVASDTFKYLQNCAEYVCRQHAVKMTVHTSSHCQRVVLSWAVPDHSTM